MNERNITNAIDRYISKQDTVAIGTSEMGEKFLKKLAVLNEKKKLDIRFVPTSTRLAAVASSFGLEIVSLDEEEIDVAIEFVDQVDENFNFIKRHSHSLVRDKMIAQSAANLIVVCEKWNLVKKLSGSIPFEISSFGANRTLNQLENLGNAKLRVKHGNVLKTESNNYMVDVEIDEIYSLEELEYQAKEIPGVLETGLFIGYADTAVLYGQEHVEVKSRLKGE